MAAPKCPYCGTLNSVSEPKCYQCQQPLPGPLMRMIRGWVHAALGRDLWITKLFIAVNLLSFVLMVLDNTRSVDGGLPLPFQKNTITVSAMIRAGVLVELLKEEWWRYLSATFFHFDLLHIAFNMAWLGFLGRVLEPELGSARFTFIYLLAGIGGFLANALLGDIPLTGGASGAVFGLFGTLVGYSLAKKSQLWREHMTRLVLFVVLSAVLGGVDGGGVNNTAHIGGAVVGGLLGYLFGREARSPRTTRWLNSLAVLAVLAVFASLVLSQLSPAWQQYRELVESPDNIW